MLKKILFSLLLIIIFPKICFSQENLYYLKCSMIDTVTKHSSSIQKEKTKKDLYFYADPVKQKLYLENKNEIKSKWDIGNVYFLYGSDIEILGLIDRSDGDIEAQTTFKQKDKIYLQTYGKGNCAVYKDKPSFFWLNWDFLNTKKLNNKKAHYYDNLF